MLRKQDLPGIYVIPSAQNSFCKYICVIRLIYYHIPSKTHEAILSPQLNFILFATWILGNCRCFVVHQVVIVLVSCVVKVA